jgi:hypothetical protein
MLQWTLLLIAAQPLWHATPSEAGLLARTRRAVQRAALSEISLHRLEKLLPRTNVSRWQRLQRLVAPDRRDYADVTLMLAYYGVEYDTNERRLLRPYYAWKRFQKSVRTSSGGDVLPRSNSDASAADPVDVPGELALLYRKHHDRRSLGDLLSLETDGSIAEAQADVLQYLWDERPVTLLRAAYGSSTRLHVLADMLETGIETPADRAANIADLKAFSRRADARVAGSARRLIGLLRAHARPNR